MPYVLIGRKHEFYGRRLWEIVGHLKNFGVGRMVVRSRFQRYPEPCFYRIVSAEPEMDNGTPHRDEDNMKGRVLVEQVFRGKNYGLVDISRVAYKTDFRLIHKHEEAEYLEAYENCTPPPVKIFPQTIDMPPLLKILAEREGHSSNTLKINVGNKRCTSRVAKDGEKPTVDISIGLGTPLSPQLYKGVL